MRKVTKAKYLFLIMAFVIICGVIPKVVTAGSEPTNYSQNKFSSSFMAPKAKFVDINGNGFDGLIAAREYDGGATAGEIQWLWSEILGDSDPPASTNKGSVELEKKYSEGNFLSGAEFELTAVNSLLDGVKVSGANNWNQNDNILYFTTSNEKITIRNLPLDDYTLVETKSPAGYITPNFNEQFSLTDTELKKSFTGENAVINEEEPEYEVEITKRDSDTKSVITSNTATIQFDLYPKTNEMLAAGSGYIDENGKLVFSHLSAGSYILVETVVSGDYIGAKPIEFTLPNEAMDGSLKYELTVENTPFPTSYDEGSFFLLAWKVRNKGNGQSIALPGVDFELEEIGEYGEKVQGTSNESGQIVFDDNVNSELSIHSDYLLTEVALPLGFDYPDTTTTPGAFLIAYQPEGDTLLINNEPAERLAPMVFKFEIDNVEKLYSLTLEKKDTDSNLLSGAKFDLYEASRSAKGQFYISEGAKPVLKDLTTDSNGKITISDIETGLYCFVETEAPEGYQLSTEGLYFELSHRSDGGWVVVYKATGEVVAEGSEDIPIIFTNEPEVPTPPKLYSLTLEKKDTDGNLLSGAKFDLYEASRSASGQFYISEGAKPVLKDLNTDSNGKITISNIETGLYCFVETEAPEGYQLSTEGLYFELSHSSDGGWVVVYKATGEVVVKGSGDKPIIFINEPEVPTPPPSSSSELSESPMPTLSESPAPAPTPTPTPTPIAPIEPEEEIPPEPSITIVHGEEDDSFIILDADGAPKLNPVTGISESSLYMPMIMVIFMAGLLVLAQLLIMRKSLHK